MSLGRSSASHRVEADFRPVTLLAPQALSANGDFDESLGLTPKTAADLAKKKQQQAAAKKGNTDDGARKVKKPKTRQIVLDDETELAWQEGRSKNVRFQEVRFRVLSFALALCGG